MFIKPPSITDTLPPQHVPEAEVDLEKCRLLFRNTGVAQAVVAINGTIVLFILQVLSGLPPPHWAVAWLLLVYAVAGLRYAFSRSFLNGPQAAADAWRWRRHATRWALIAGLVWASGGIGLMLADPDATRMFTALVIAGMVSGAVPILSSVPAAFRAYAVPVMLAIVATALLDSHGPRDWMLALVSTLYLFALLRSASYFHGTLDNSIRLALNMRQMAGQLEQARRDAEASSSAKSQFLAMMSHEIRTPLNGILGMAQVLLKPDLREAERQDYTRTILDSGQTLLTLLNDVLDFSKIEAGKLELSLGECELGRIIGETATLFAEPARRKGLRIETQCEAEDATTRYRADATRLRQMLSNLVNNAIKFTAQGVVRIEARELSRNGDTAVIELAVTDSGIGIPSERQASLFQPFVQIDNSSTRQFGGTGLGLSIVRLLADMMGGAVGVESQPGKGSRFWFRVPLETVAASSEEALTAAAAPAAWDVPPARSVLVVEDNEINRKVVGTMLSKLGFQVSYVGNGQLAVEAVANRAAADVILMDCQMPVMDGFEATRRIRALEHSEGRERTPIIALTAAAFQEDREQCLAVGMDDFLTKPVNFADLGSVLRKWSAVVRRDGV